MGTILAYSTDKRVRIHSVGYVFANWESVRYFSVSESDKPFAACRMETVFSNSRMSVCYFGSLAAAWDLMNTPVFYGRRCFWFGKCYEIKPNTQNLQSHER